MIELTEKENAILCVLDKRIICTEKGVAAQEKRISELEEEIKQRKNMIEYLKAKREGYQQAIDLLKSNLESINIEL